MDLSAEVTTLKGVGPKTAEILEKAGLRTVRDILYYLPRDYEDYQTAVKISDLQPGKVMIKGKIDGLHTNYTRRRNFAITEGHISDGTGDVRVVWFNQPYRAKQFQEGKDYYFTGQFDFKYNRYQLTSPTAVLATEVEHQQNGFQPIYKAKGKLNNVFFKKLLASLRESIALTPDLLPTDRATSEGTNAPDFVTPGARADALLNIHFPQQKSDVEQGRRYLAYEEVYELILAAKLNRQANQKLKSIKCQFNAKKTKSLVSSLPFRLTNAQRIATWDILQDLEKPTPMNRLLQGDVGSGKTIVAALAAHQTAQNGHQTAILAPTAVLAKQHYDGLSELLKPYSVRVALLTGATKHKPELKKQIRDGEIDLVIGTHALITDDTVFHSLALCIIDEQHRFGVNQRQKLLEKTAITQPGFAPHFLAMTATPIPRSLQLTIFGDLDVSILNELPKGRQEIKTTIISETEQKDKLYPEIRQKLANKEQVYWICKAIEDNPMTETASVKKQVKKLQELFPKYQIAFLHGRMKQDEKDQIMQDFADNKIHLLVSTTVVEVGVNVPNATLIVIQDAENYGLAQLHQLRGRVGRGQKQSYCYLLTKGENPPSRRLRELEKSTDGFYLAEVDLKLRGPGEIYGNLQHGALDLKIASLSDTHLIAAAGKQATLLASQPENMLQYPELARSIRKYQQLTTLN
ncbi:ATP-dependent DNA helicase RecG [Candidatus Saccharibacteria bacterium]|nr:ATP-dependent DNA helicase RecG [Candidatus Saccharibacteria bacterium]